ncbi:hypothetical protein KVR01_013142 [Diaporthe batatas]|uniref:uncharacterized protein n=1 Tax=Diaporthe batatas TaxID=748121 RepID=UPI001D03AC36|nr:uncharacterized protein KVR01_013142 [Diaporthe batatas]KAG8156920.1 hypothetical protein KVR01_013142 [Diaporthe batatas]
MCMTTVLRGFKVPLPILDAFLLANNIYESESLCRGIPPFYEYNSVDEVTTLLRNKVGNGDNKTRIFIPSRTGFDFASSAYIAFDWIVVFAQHKLTEFDTSPPPGFEELRREILSYAEGDVSQDAKYQNSVYVVITDGRFLNPPEIHNRKMLETEQPSAEVWMEID